MNKSVFVSSVLCLLFVACGGGKNVHEEKQVSCSCSTYLPASPRPKWVDAEQITAEKYVSNGIAECTGIQSHDFKTADQTARANLTRMLNTHVQSEILSVKGDYGFGAGYNKGEIRSLLASEALLDNSSVFSRWVDPRTCVVYAGVQIARADVVGAIRKIAEKNKNKLINQLFSVSSSGEFKAEIERRLVSMLSKAGVNKVSQTNNGEAFVLNAKLTENDYGASPTVVRARVFLRIMAPDKNLVWGKQFSGKGVSFKKKPKNVMVGMAIEDALDKALDGLKEALSKSKPR